MSKVYVNLCEQDLAEFLDNNEEYMEAYVKELRDRLNKNYDKVTVNLDSNALSDTIAINDDVDEFGEVDHIMSQMVNDWDWLPE